MQMVRLNKIIVLLGSLVLGLASAFFSTYNLSLESLLWQPIIPFAAFTLGLIIWAGKCKFWKCLLFIFFLCISYVVAIALYMSCTVSMVVGAGCVTVSLYFLFRFHSKKYLIVALIVVALTGIAFDVWLNVYIYNNVAPLESPGTLQPFVKAMIFVWQVETILGIGMQCAHEKIGTKSWVAL